MPVVDDPPVVRRGLRVLTVEVVDRPQHGAEQLVLDRPHDEHVVGGDARLAGVGEAAPGDPSGGDVDVGVGGDDRRALAAEFECHGCQVLGRRPHDDVGDRSAAGVQDVVEPFGEQRGGLFDTALDDLHDPLIEVARYQLGDHRRGRRSRLRRLEDRRVAGGEGADERGQRQVQRIVPRAR